MARRQLLATTGIVALLLASASTLGDALEMRTVDKELQAQDLANLAEAVGVQFEIFDYEVAEPHCIHFFVDEIDSVDAVTRHDGHGLCGLAGQQRLTIQWKADAGEATFRFMRFRRDSKQGGSVSGPTISIPESGGFSTYGIEPPVLNYDRETELLHGAYGWNDGPRAEFKVLAELRPNPRGSIGTE